MLPPDRGDIVKLDFSPSAGHEQAQYRPALVLSPKSYNSKVGLAVICAVTNQQKGYPFEVVLPSNLKTTGVILADQIRTVDWVIRKAQITDHVSAEIVEQVQEKLLKLIL